MKETLKKYDIITKVLSVFAAVILWVYVMNSINPVLTMSFNGFTVQLQGETQILNGHSLSVIDGAQSTVSLKITGTRNRLLSLKNSSVKVVADISGLKKAGTYQVPYTVELPNDLLSVASKMPDTITVKVDQIISKSITIKSVVKGTSNGDYIYQNPELSDDTLTITGPKAEIDKIDHAEVVIAANNLTYDLKHEYNILLLNSRGKEIHSPNITKSIGTVSVAMPVYQKKSLNLRADVVYPNDITADQVSLTFSPKSVTVYGSESALKDLTDLTVMKIDLSKVKDGDTVDFTINPPSHVYLFDKDSTSGKITVHIDSKTSKKITVSSFNQKDTAEEGKAKKVTLLTDSLDVTVKGLQSALDSISAKDISADITFDSSTLTAGTQTIPVVITLDSSGVEVEGTYIVEIEVEDT